MKKDQAQGQDGVHPVQNPADDVPFEIEEPLAEDMGSVVAKSDTAADDDAPLAVTDEEMASGKPRSVWRKLSMEDLPQVSLREFLGGDYLLGSFLRNNIGFILLLLMLGILYISNRYAAQQEIIEEEQLRKQLTEKKNYALTQYAQLTMNSRQSALEQRLYALGDSMLLVPKKAPYIIKMKSEE